MKTAKDPRHLKRIETVKALFADSFTPQEGESDDIKEIHKSRKSIDKLIKEAAPQWPLDKLNKIDLAILRLAVFELTKTKTPPKVIIDEAVELAKRYGSENSFSFVNGVLGTIYKDMQKIDDNNNEQKKA